MVICPPCCLTIQCNGSFWLTPGPLRQQIVSASRTMKAARTIKTAQAIKTAQTIKTAQVGKKQQSLENP
jgi:hypothetical protein